MNICSRYNYHPHNPNFITIRLISKHPISVSFVNKEQISDVCAEVKYLLSSSIYIRDSFCVSKYSNQDDIQKVVLKLQTSDMIDNMPIFFIFFAMDDRSHDHVPSIEIKALERKPKNHYIAIDFVINIDPCDGNLYDALFDSVCSYVVDYFHALSYFCDELGFLPSKLSSFNFIYDAFIYNVKYPWELNETLESAWRVEIHKSNSLSLCAPLFRRGQALHPVPRFSDWLGPNEQLLVCPHENIKALQGGTTYVMKGRYTYKHYLQDGIDDKNWGCAYRSLQTLISWLMWQGEVTAGPLPSISDIQRSLVLCGDKQQNFYGSHQWIGSLEINFCMQELYKIDCQILHVPQGSQIPQLAVAMLIRHFSSGGGPVMIGGGQLAHTIIGVHLPDDDNGALPNYTKARYLVLDPHFTGPSGNLKLVLDKGWCGWKQQNFWKPNVHYNLCCVPCTKNNCP